ncbi:hypothetical protein KHQ81_13545 [Mycoplasmatota bacterium]|nr:hypothetical protein KHQ81_13545 [Mycoplasmatota bacterium]
MKKIIQLVTPILIFPFSFFIYLIISPFLASWLGCGCRSVDGEYIKGFGVNDVRLPYFILTGLITLIFVIRNTKLLNKLYKYFYVAIYIIIIYLLIIIIHDSQMFLFK